MTAPARISQADMERALRPHWPAMMCDGTAAQYLDMTKGEFLKAVGAGTLPAPVTLGRKQRWAKVAIDRCVAALADLDQSDWRSDSRLYDAA